MKLHSLNNLLWKLILFILIPSVGEAQKSVNKRPNIVLIMADDLGYGSLGCYGNKNIQTPNIDFMSAEGMRFTEYHSNGSHSALVIWGNLGSSKGAMETEWRC